MTRRLFVATWLPEAAAREALGVRSGLRTAGDGVKWVSPENLHVTLRFLGDVEEDRLPGLVECVHRVGAGFAPFEIRLAGVGTFPRRGVPRVVWIGIDRGVKELARLASRTEKLLLDQGLIRAPETRPFRAHVTLGRPRDSRHLERLVDLLGRVAFEGGAHRLEEVRLVESRLSPRGAEYIAVARVPLSGARTSEKKTHEGGAT